MSMKNLKKILYVEDEPDIRLIAVMALETLGGFTLESCESGREAVAKAPEFSPDLLLLDVMMPGMDGPTTLLALRDLPGLADTPAVFMTAKVQSQEIDEYLELGAVDVIAKPFDPMTLAARIEDIWHRTQEG
ncbi:MAG TPA: response regulator [Aromatoleum sp.]|uniref:response regulator n=1 Tax=Aromatoleum sp. TaxID=2307007 RepID=UPI002B4A8A39|nr:response regulator [Aromatoleum sp.]HJV27490.1 response regulator [Aromatoleum sp.]